VSGSLGEAKEVSKLRSVFASSLYLCLDFSATSAENPLSQAYECCETSSATSELNQTVLGSLKTAMCFCVKINLKNFIVEFFKLCCSFEVRSGSTALSTFTIGFLIPSYVDPVAVVYTRSCTWKIATIQLCHFLLSVVAVFQI
jgi:hypothetical protein